MTEYPMPAVKALIKKEGKILALRTETKDSHYWVLPGGRIEYGEEPRKALSREVEEEISCDPEIKDPIGMYHFYMGEEDEGDQVVLTVFNADIGDQEVDIEDNPADENISEYRWFTPEEFVQKTDNESLIYLLDEASELPKLVRDEIPDMIESGEERPVVKELEDEEAEEFLRQKIVEEVEELEESGEKEELADLLEAIDRYMEVEGIKDEEIEELREEKKDSRGGFENNTVLLEVIRKKLSSPE